MLIWTKDWVNRKREREREKIAKSLLSQCEGEAGIRQDSIVRKIV